MALPQSVLVVPGEDDSGCHAPDLEAHKINLDYEKIDLVQQH
jgi:hypothetical protein